MILPWQIFNSDLIELNFSRYIHSKNRAGLTFRLAPNHLTDHSSDELAYMRGKLRSKGFNGGKPFHFKKEEVENLPEQMDWRLYGAVSSVKGLFHKMTHYF